MQKLTFNQATATRYLTIIAKGTRGEYSIIIDDANIRVFNNATAKTIHTLNWTS